MGLAETVSTASSAALESAVTVTLVPHPEGSIRTVPLARSPPRRCLGHAHLELAQLLRGGDQLDQLRL